MRSAIPRELPSSSRRTLPSPRWTELIVAIVPIVWSMSGVTVSASWRWATAKTRRSVVFRAASIARRVPGRPAEMGVLTPGRRTELRIGTTGRLRVSDMDDTSFSALNYAAGGGPDSARPLGASRAPQFRPSHGRARLPNASAGGAIPGTGGGAGAPGIGSPSVEEQR